MEISYESISADQVSSVLQRLLDGKKPNFSTGVVNLCFSPQNTILENIASPPVGGPVGLENETLHTHFVMDM